MTNNDKQREYLKKYREKKPHMNNYCSKKAYWKAWFEEDYIKSLYDKHGDKAFDMLKKIKKEQKEKIKEQHKKESAKMLLNSLKSISVN